MIDHKDGEQNPVVVSSIVRLPSQIRRDQTIFTDLGSLEEIASSWSAPGDGVLDHDSWRAQCLASGIECLILYEQVACDSLFFETNRRLQSWLTIYRGR
jgi:hypothetical protein